jgi:hypothetical protein
LQEEQLFVSINENTNSIAVIIKHMSGNMLSRWTDFLTSDGEKNGATEILNLMKHYSKEEIMELWNAGWNYFLMP